MYFIKSCQTVSFISGLLTNLIWPEMFWSHNYFYSVKFTLTLKYFTVLFPALTITNVILRLQVRLESLYLLLKISFGSIYLSAKSSDVTWFDRPIISCRSKLSKSSNPLPFQVSIKLISIYNTWDILSQHLRSKELNFH